MKFLIDRPAFVAGEYLSASVQDPIVKEFPANASLDHISRSWKPLDEEAIAALEKLGVRKPRLALEPENRPGAAPVSTMAEAQLARRPQVPAGPAADSSVKADGAES
jgi:hypothetical protein